MAADVDECRVVALGKAIRMAHMLGSLLAMLRDTTIDPTESLRVLDAYRAALIEVGSTLSDALLDELGRVQTALDSEPTRDELRIAVSQLEGWLIGVLDGVNEGELSFEVRADLETTLQT